MFFLLPSRGGVSRVSEGIYVVVTKYIDGDAISRESHCEVRPNIIGLLPLCRIFVVASNREGG